MRPIKFRGVVIGRRAAVGREADIGDIVKGSLIIEGNDATPLYFIRQQVEGYAAIDYPVDPDSIAQLVGYDKNGREVYEGDKVISEYGDEVVARLMDNLPPKAKFKEAQS